MSARNGHRRRYKQGPRPRDLAAVNRHMDRRRARATLRQLRYLRMPQLLMPDVAIGAALGFGVLAMVLTIAGLVG